jgi:hypothetical protein
VPEDDPIIDLEELLNPDEQHQFRLLCLDTSAEELAQLTFVVELHLEHIRDHDGPNADVETAEAIGASLTKLLNDDASFDADERSLIRGAVEYFLLADDASGDLDDVFGFDDDARVLNSVLDRIGKPEYRVELA